MSSYEIRRNASHTGHDWFNVLLLRAPYTIHEQIGAWHIIGATSTLHGARKLVARRTQVVVERDGNPVLPDLRIVGELTPPAA